MMTGASLANVLDQCMYFGLAMGRVGADFRVLLVCFFEREKKKIFENQFKFRKKIKMVL